LSRETRAEMWFLTKVIVLPRRYAKGAKARKGRFLAAKQPVFPSWEAGLLGSKKFQAICLKIPCQFWRGFLPSHIGVNVRNCRVGTAHRACPQLPALHSSIVVFALMVGGAHPTCSLCHSREGGNPRPEFQKDGDSRSRGCPYLGTRRLRSV